MTLFALITTRSSAFASDMLARSSDEHMPSRKAVINSASSLRKSGESRG